MQDDTKRNNKTFNLNSSKMLARFFHQSSTHVQRHTRSNVTIAPPSCKQRLKGIKHSYKWWNAFHNKQAVKDKKFNTIHTKYYIVEKFVPNLIKTVSYSKYRYLQHDPTLKKDISTNSNLNQKKQSNQYNRVDESFIVHEKQKLQDFRAGLIRGGPMIYSSTLTNHERFYIHSVASAGGLISESFGSGETRHITVRLPTEEHKANLLETYETIETTHYTEETKDDDTWSANYRKQIMAFDEDNEEIDIVKEEKVKKKNVKRQNNLQLDSGKLVNPYGDLEMAFLASKRQFGKRAVDRNRARRRVKEAARNIFLNQLDTSWWYVVQIKEAVNEATPEELWATLEETRTTLQKDYTEKW